MLSTATIKTDSGTKHLEVHAGELPFPVAETVDAMLNAALAVAYARLDNEGLGPCPGDVAPWEMSALDAFGETLLRFACTNAPGLRSEPVEIVYYDRVQGHTVTGADPMEWEGEFARLVADPDVLSAHAMRNGETLADYDRVTTPTVSERIRRRRQARAVVTGDLDPRVAALADALGEGWEVRVDATGGGCEWAVMAHRDSDGSGRFYVATDGDAGVPDVGQPWGWVGTFADNVATEYDDVDSGTFTAAEVARIVTADYRPPTPPVEVLVHVNVTVDGDTVTASVPLAERIA